MPSISTQLQAAHDALLSRDLVEGLLDPAAPDHIRNIPELRHPLLLAVKKRLIENKINKAQAAHEALKAYFQLQNFP